MSSPDGPESDGVYEWYRRGRALHDEGHPAAAVQLLARAVAAEPTARSLREALARAQFDARWFDDARANFAVIVEADPGDHYALFGLGLAESRLGRFEAAVEHLALATAMRPDLPHYASALRQARATLRARADAGAGGGGGGRGAVRSWLREAPGPLVADVDAVLLDLDGTVYVGPTAVPGAAAALAAVRGAGARVAFVTNNASLPAQAVADRLTALGVPATDSEVVTSAQAAAGLLAERLPTGGRVLVVGGAGLTAALHEVGLVPVASAVEAPEAVVQGWAPELDWRQLAQASYALAAGLPWVVCNTDATIPTDEGIAPGNGSFVALLSAVTGRAPDAVAGKPARALLDRATDRLAARHPLVVGDRLDTDVAAAAAAGLPSMLVLTGVTTETDLLGAGPRQRPTYLAADLGGLLTAHPAPVEVDGWWHCRQSRARVLEGGELQVERAGDDLDAVRAACAAAWSAADAGTPRTG